MKRYIYFYRAQENSNSGEQYTFTGIISTAHPIDSQERYDKVKEKMCEATAADPENLTVHTLNFLHEKIDDEEVPPEAGI